MDHPDLRVLRLDEIKIPDGRRSAPHVVSLLRESIARVGVINPVTVAPDLTLVAGMNRVVAARELGLDHIPAIVLAQGEPVREIELSENLARLHLTPEQLAECRAFEAQLLAEKQATMSLRAAAEETGVPWTTAKRRVAKGTGLSTGPGGPVERSPDDEEVAPTTKRRGKDGKKRPAKRRSATAIEKRRAQAKALRDEGKSLPKIAKTLGVSLGTVAGDITAEPADLASRPRKRGEATEDVVLPLPAKQLAILDELRGATPRVEWLLTLVQAALAPAAASRTRALVARALAEASAEPALSTVVHDLELALEQLAS